MDSTGDGDVSLPLKVAFIPFASPGHTNPMMDIARLFARHGAEATYFTTPTGAARYMNAVDSDAKSGYNIKIHTCPFPGEKFGLPPGIESFDKVSDMEAFEKLHAAFEMVKVEIQRHLIEEIKVDCIVSDPIHCWTADLAIQLGVPRISTRFACCISECVFHSLKCHRPHEKVESDDEPFLVPGLPHKIEMTLSQVPQWSFSSDSLMAPFIEKMDKAEKQSFGTILNTFYEIERDYIECYSTIFSNKLWAIGPVSLWINKEIEKDAQITEDDDHTRMIMNWLDSKQPNSVLYISFGSMAKFSNSQLIEIARGIEESGHQFIWVIRKLDPEESEEEFLPDGFEERMGKKCLIIRNWAPQVKILNHGAIGGFFTHCGWNSTLESVSSGKPVITWALAADQFANEKLLTEILKTGVSIGAKKCLNVLFPKIDKAYVSKDDIRKAVEFLMGDEEEAVQIRDRAKMYAGLANEAVGNGGSSQTSFISLIHELKSMKLKRRHFEG